MKERQEWPWHEEWVQTFIIVDIVTIFPNCCLCLLILAIFLNPVLGLTGFFTQSEDLRVSSPRLGTYWFLHPVLGLTGFFIQLWTYWFLNPAWDLLISSPRLGTYWFLSLRYVSAVVSSLVWSVDRLAFSSSYKQMLSLLSVIYGW